MKKLLIFLTFISFGCSSPKSDIQLFSLFQDHMVLQQDTTIAIWGWGTAGTEIAIEGSWGGAGSAVASADGKWMSSIPTSEAGGPYDVVIKAADTMIQIQDVMLGEVWLASGQSNMQMPLTGWPPNDTINNSAMEIAGADHPDIRMFTVARALSESEEEQVSGEWLVSNPENAGSFSASAYFFARKLQENLQVPIGVIHSSWGGTPAEAWTSAASLKELDDFEGILEQMENDRPEREKLREWQASLDQVAVSPSASIEEWKALQFNDAGFIAEGFSDEKWPSMNLPLAWEQGEIGSFDGVVWFRKTFILDELEQMATVYLGAIDDRDQTYVNGVLIGEHMDVGQWQDQRIYSIPDGVLKKGSNVIAVKVIDTGGGGGIYRADQGMHLKGNSGKTVDLAGEWKYKAVADYQSNTFYLFNDAQSATKPLVKTTLNSNSPTVLFNAMIHPLVPFTIKGAIWYQGESNVGRATQYETLFPAMISDWRSSWGKEFSFYFVQIAPFQYEENGTRSAALRDAQRKSLHVTNTGMVVALDIGNNTNIHPGNKQDVGGRLALWALANDYDQDIVYSGPLVKEMTATEDQIVLTFTHVGGGLKLTEATGFEVSTDGKLFLEAPASVQDGSVVLDVKDASQVTIVRYAWSDTAEATLFNIEELPASSFQLTR